MHYILWLVPEVDLYVYLYILYIIISVCVLLL